MSVASRKQYLANYTFAYQRIKRLEKIGNIQNDYNVSYISEITPQS